MRLIGANEIGVGVAKNAAFVFLGEEGENAGASLATHGEEVVVEAAGVAAERDGMEVECESRCLREQHGCEGLDPTGAELLLLRALRAVGVAGGETFLGQDVEAGEQSQCFVTPISTWRGANARKQG